MTNRHPDMPEQPGNDPFTGNAAPMDPDRDDHESHGRPRPSLDDIEARLRQARGEPDPRDGGPSGFGGGQSGRGLNIALRMGTELVAAVVVGAGMGWFLDQWLGTWPVLFLIFFMLGAATGFRNVIRLANRLNPDPSDPADKQ